MGAPDKASILYICWLVPSTISFALSLYLATYIIFRRNEQDSQDSVKFQVKTRKKLQKYHLLVLTLCFVDFIKSGCWFLGEKYTNPYDLCFVQEIMMQMGTLYQNYTCLLMCILAFAAINSTDSRICKNILKSSRSFLVVSAGIMLIPTLSVLLSACLRSPKLWCNVDMPVYDTAPRDVQIAIIAYNTCFLLPQFLALFTEVGVCIAIGHKYRISLTEMSELRSIEGSRDSSKAEKSLTDFSRWSLAWKLLVYPIVFIIGWIPDAVTLLVSVTTGFESVVTRGFTNACAGTVGIVIVIMYFWTNRHSNSSSHSGHEQDVTASSFSSKDSSSTVASNPLVNEEEFEIGIINNTEGAIRKCRSMNTNDGSDANSKSSRSS